MEDLISQKFFSLLVSENIDWKSYQRGHVQREDKIWLASTFRVMLIKMGIDKAGSINQLGRELGYRSRVHPGWSIRQILLGKQPFSMERLKLISDYLGYPMEDILRHRTQPGAITLDGTRRALEMSGLMYYIPR